MALRSPASEHQPVALLSPPHPRPGQESRFGGVAGCVLRWALGIGTSANISHIGKEGGGFGQGALFAGGKIADLVYGEMTR